MKQKDAKQFLNAHNVRKILMQRQDIIRHGVKAVGSFNPTEVLPYFEESLYTDEVEAIKNFLKWCDRGNPFGHNYPEMVQRYFMQLYNQ